jgi:hypothetical protein
LNAPRDFWLACGHHLLDRDAGGGLLVTEAFLKAYLARPELAPPADACAAELALHRGLLADPRRPVQASEIAAIADADARENWEVMIAFRDLLAGHRTLEAAYLTIVRQSIKVPHIFLNQIVHVILRNVLDDSTDAYVLRAAELFFRPQKLTVHDGSLLAADEETISGMGSKPLSPLVSMLGLPAAAEIDVLSDATASLYWERSDLFDMALDLTAGRRGLTALGEVIERWVAHLLSIRVTVEPLVELQNAPFTWYVGLDADATQIGDALWKGESIDDGLRERVVALYRLMFDDPRVMMQNIHGEDIYLLAAMSTDKVLRLKPQNLLVGLPVEHQEAVS